MRIATVCTRHISIQHTRDETTSTITQNFTNQTKISKPISPPPPIPLQALTNHTTLIHLSTKMIKKLTQATTLS